MNIKCVDIRIAHNANDDNPYGIKTTTVTYEDNSTEIIRSFSGPREVELFCSKAYVDSVKTSDETGTVVHMHYEGKHPYVN